jgi:hypothetical protein
MRDDAGVSRGGERGFLPRGPGEYASSGKVASLDQLASVTVSCVVGGDAEGCRALDMRAAGGIDLRILPDRHHANVGVPLFDEGARVEIDSEEVFPRDADAERGRVSWMAPGPPERGAVTELRILVRSVPGAA